MVRSGRGCRRDLVERRGTVVDGEAVVADVDGVEHQEQQDGGAPATRPRRRDQVDQPGEDGPAMMTAVESH
jgi:hypothetical protein